VHGRNREREGNVKLGCGWCAHCIGVNIVILNSQRPVWEGDQEVVKGSGRDEPMWVAIHMWMEAMIGISLYSYLYLKLAKMLFLSYYPLCFLLNKILEQEGRTSFTQNWVGRGSWWEGMANNIYTCHVSTCKMIK
jgi:hypothetical protein